MRTRYLMLPVAGLIVASCSATSSTPTWTYAPQSPIPVAAAEAVIEVYKSPTCTCCHEWEAYLRSNGFNMRSIPIEDMAAIKADRGVPAYAQSCHTAVIEGYTVEGHVPVEAIGDLLAQRPPIDGIALPGMPAGSPGMPGQQAAPLEILSLDDGETSTFGSY
jgi:hypothetical protein